MSGATFSRIKNWTTEVLTNTDLNIEIDNILNHMDATGVGDYSDTASMMRLNTNPGTTGNESLATSLAGELERLRYVLKRLIGSAAANWYDLPPTDLTTIVAAFAGTGLPPNRIISGRTTGNSSQLCALIPAGTTASLVLSASVTPFIYSIATNPYTISVNQTISGLSLAVASNNTCSVSETASTNNFFLGQYGTSIEVSAMGTGIVSLLGSIAGFKSSANEYFLGYVNTTSALTNAWRGGFFNSAGTAVQNATLANTTGITLMRLAWIFANTNSSLAVTYTNPTVSGVQPTSPNTGDYWYDLSATAWKTFNSTVWVAANATLIGMSLQDTGSCVAARTFDSYTALSDLNQMSLQSASSTVVQAAEAYAQVAVFGSSNAFQNSRPTWDIAANLDAASARTASTNYYFYMKESGAPVVSWLPPNDRKDLRGLYYPGETWRCLGMAQTDSSSAFMNPVRSFRGAASTSMLLGDPTQYNALNTSAFGVDLPLPSDIFPNDLIAVITGSTTLGSPAFNVATFSLTPGVWSLSAYIILSTTPGTPAAATFSSYLTTQQTGSVVGFTPYGGIGGSYISNVSGHQSSCVMPNCLAVVKSVQTYYLKAIVSTVSAATYSTTWGISGRRIDSLTGVPR